jgi:hypothetical protein
VPRITPCTERVDSPNDINVRAVSCHGFKCDANRVTAGAGLPLFSRTTLAGGTSDQAGVGENRDGNALRPL